MGKGCLYWIFIGFWLEPIILVFRLIAYVIRGISRDKQKKNQNYYTQQYNNGSFINPVSMEDFEDIRNELREELREELKEELCEEIYQDILNEKER